MNKSRVLISCTLITVISSINIPQAFSAPLVFNGSGPHIIDYVTNDGVVNGSTLFVQDGASISGSVPIGVTNDPTILSYGTLNVQGGEIKGPVYFDNAGEFNMSDGVVEGALVLVSANAIISGGIIDSIFSEGNSALDISGGTFGNIDTISGTYNISGGNFLGLLSGLALHPNLKISGGNFSGGFEYGNYADYEIFPAFTFFGNLSLTTPDFVTAGHYETIISGTLADGDSISQTIKCYDSECIGVSINSVPIPATLWLFGSGLIGLIGVARSKKAQLNK